VLGIDFGGTQTAVAVGEPTPGPRLGAATVPTHAAEGGKASLGRGLRAARALLDRVAPGREPVAVGVSTIGIPRESGVDLAPNIPGWADLALAEEIRLAFPASEVRVETDVKAAARVEAVEGALVGADPGLYLNLGTGLAIAIVTNGEVVAGRNGASGEIGYNLRALTDVGVPAGQREILEDRVSGIGLLARARELFPDAIGAKDLFAAASRDPRAAAVLQEFTDELAFHLVNLTIALDPARIAVGGGMVRSWPVLHGPLRRALDAAVPFPPELVQAAFPFDAPLAGALTLARTAVGNLHDLKTPLMTTD
jgi:glucokinase